MKIVYSWLKEWVDVPWDARELGARLTMAGFELEALEVHGEDAVLELNITPNRGDAMSVLGIAREVAALSGMSPPLRSGGRLERGHGDTLPVQLDAPAACPKFAGCIVHGVNNRVATPSWMRDRLERAGVRSLSPLVDVTNYVLLELGQPMHAYDLARVRGGIHVRHASAGEPLTLLDGREIEADAGLLLIADSEGAIGAAGIMGGERTAVSASTTDVFLEVAYFAPDALLGRARNLGLQTDASQRFERGVDPALQEHAMERATELIFSIAGGQAGPVQVTQAAEHLPRRQAVSLRRMQLKKLLGTEIEDRRVTQVLSSLGMQVEVGEGDWRVTPPSHRFDIAIEADLIEEVARITGFESIPETDAVVPQRFGALPTEQSAERSVLEALVARSYHETITLAFVAPAFQARLLPERSSVALANPIASDLAAMRTSLWPGLLHAALENQRRQQDRIRLFEHGRRFVPEEIDTLAGLAWGARWPEQWAASKTERTAVDFFDVKADVAALLAGTGVREEFSFEAATLACLHPGRAARVRRAGQLVGWIGELHPALVSELGFTYAPVVFELDFAAALRVAKPTYHGISRFPQVRRDLAVVVDEAMSFSALHERVTFAAGSLVADCLVFDVYRGPGIETGRKSVALGLIFQDISRTLTDKDVDEAVASIVAELRNRANAKIRE